MTTLRDLKRQNMVSWLEHEAIALGTVAQRDAHARDALPDAEIAALARGTLFAGFEGAPRWQPIRWQDCPHTSSCTATREVVVKSKRWPYEEPPAYVNAALYAALRVSMVALVTHPWAVRFPSIMASLDVHTHTATCAACNGLIRRASALITIPWARRTLSREYAL